MNYGWRFVTLYRRQGARPSPWKRNAKKKSKMAVWGGLTNSCENKVAQSCPTLCNSMDIAHQAPLSLEFSRQGYQSGLQCPPPGDLPDPGIKLGSPALQADSLPTEL